jgi:glucose/mannose-6-phosphate isomerase
MMNLNDISSFSKTDPQNMLTHIDGLPDQLQAAWELGYQHSLPAWKDIDRVLVAGMGGSAIGADLLAAYAAPACPVPLVVHRDYDLPAWANGPHTLVIAASHSGNTEEALSSFDRAGQNGCLRLAITTGGQLAQAATQAGAPLWTFVHLGQPRAAVGFSFGLLLAAFTRLGLISDPSEELAGALAAMRVQQSSLLAEVPVARNPAKRMAGQLFGRWVMVMGAGVLAPVAHRWKTQVNELAKAWAQYDYLPEADHNTIAGIACPEELLTKMMVLFLRAPSDHPRNRLRTDLTRQICMMEGLNTDNYDSQGESPLAHLWTALHFGDYQAFYLAMAYGADPTPIPAINELKKEMQTG